MINKIENLFVNDELSRKVFFAYYEKSRLPELEQKHNRVIAENEATNELLALTEGKTAGQIKTMIKILKGHKKLIAA
jgi:hypothetical protein